MFPPPYADWLKKRNIVKIATENSIYLRKIFTECLAAKREDILIIGDGGVGDNYISPILSASYYIAAKSLNLKAEMILQNVKYRGEFASMKMIKALQDLEPGSIIIFNLSDKPGRLGNIGKSFRKFCRKNKHKFVSTLSLGYLKTHHIKDIVSAFDVDYEELIETHAKLKEILDKTNEIRVQTKAGTDLRIGVKGMKAVSADGNYSSPGRGGNLPAGEVYIAPRRNQVNGEVVIDVSSRSRKRTMLVKKPITLTVKKGEIVDIEGGEEAKMIEKSLEWAESAAKYPWSIRRLGEFGIGLNPKAKILGSTIIDEKVLGTAHIAIGSNAWFGGSIYSIIHLDQVFKDPMIWVDDKYLDLKNLDRFKKIYR